LATAAGIDLKESSTCPKLDLLQRPELAKAEVWLEFAISFKANVHSPPLPPEVYLGRKLIKVMGRVMGLLQHNGESHWNNCIFRHNRRTPLPPVLAFTVIRHHSPASSKQRFAKNPVLARPARAMTFLLHPIDI
jgi:hypothetical protein